MKFKSSLMILLLVVGTTAFAEVKSGLQVGDFADAFDVKDCSSTLSRGKSLCYR